MTRRVLSLLTALSLLLCAAVVGLWGLGVVWPSDFIVARSGHILHVGTRDGRLQLAHASGHYEDRPLTWLPYGTRVLIGESIPETQ